MAVKRKKIRRISAGQSRLSSNSFKTNNKKKIGWFGESKRHSEASVKGWNSRFGKKKNYSLSDVKKIHAKRSNRARIVDNTKNSKIVGKNRYAQWVNNPARFDVLGVDTKKGSKSVLKLKEVRTFLGKRSGLNIPIYKSVDNIDSDEMADSLWEGFAKSEGYDSISLEDSKGRVRKIKPFEDDVGKSEVVEKEKTTSGVDSLINFELAKRAYSGTSFSPEQRAKSEIQYFKQDIEEVSKETLKLGKSKQQIELIENELESFKNRYASKWNEMLSSRSRVVSPMITGPANFPVRSNNKKSDSYEKKFRGLGEFKENFILSLKKKINKMVVVEGGGELNIAKNKLESLKKKHNLMKGINKIVRKKLTKDSMVSEIMKIGGSKEFAEKILKPNEYGGVGVPNFTMTNSYANIKATEDRVKILEKNAIRPTTSKRINGIEIKDNNEADRIQIFFNGKPEQSTITKLKSNGWRWSPTSGAWQRKRTNNARYEAKFLVEGLTE